MKSKMIRLCGLVASALLFVAFAPAGRADEPAAKYSLSIVRHGKGSVSGGGSFAAGRKLTLKATASRPVEAALQASFAMAETYSPPGISQI